MSSSALAIRNIKLQQYLNLISGLWFLVPVITLMYQEYWLDVGQIILISNIATITIFAFELPTSLIADLIGRKISFVLWWLCGIWAALLLLLIPSRYGFMAASFLWWLHFCFFSGTIQAFLQDNLSQIWEEQQFTKHIGNNMFMEKLSWLLVPSIASLILMWIPHGYHVLAGIDLLITCIGMYCILLFHDFSKKIHKYSLNIGWAKIKSMITEIIQQFKSNSSLKILLWFRIFGNHVAFFDLMILIILTQAWLQGEYGGFVITWSVIGWMIANYYVYSLTKHYSNQKVWYWSIVGQALLCIIAGLYIQHRYIVAVIYIIYSWLDGLRQPARNGALVQHVDSRYIATIRSVIFWCFALWTTLWKQILWLFDIQYSLIILWLFLLCVCIIFFRSICYHTCAQKNSN